MVQMNSHCLSFIHHDGMTNQPTKAGQLARRQTPNKDKDMSFIIKVPAYTIGKELLQQEINRLMNKLKATDYVIEKEEIANDGFSIDYKVVFTVKS